MLSKWSNATSVTLLLEALRARGLRTVLLSPFPDDRNRDRCDEHVLVDWDDEDLPTLTTRLDGRGIDPLAVLTMVEPLIGLRVALAAHYGLPGSSTGLDVLASKTLVRERMRALGLSAVRFSGDPAEVDFFPAIVKPARESAASWLVHRVDGPDELVAHRRHLADSGLAGTELIVEEYLPGTEFSVDGPVVGGRFHPVMAVEKPEHDDTRHHNAGLEFHPPQHEHVRAGVRALSAAVDALCTDLDLDQLWFHVEGRVTADGRAELLEINPRPAGGMYVAVTRASTGIDPIEAFVAMSLGEFTVPPPVPPRDRPVFGMVDVEADELGVVKISTTEEDLRALPGVIDAEVIDGFEIESLDKESFFVRVAVTADSVPELRDRAAAVLGRLDYRVMPSH